MSDQLDVSNTVTQEKFDPNELFSTLKMFVLGDVDGQGESFTGKINQSGYFHVFLS